MSGGTRHVSHGRSGMAGNAASLSTGTVGSYKFLNQLEPHVLWPCGCIAGWFAHTGAFSRARTARCGMLAHA